MQPGKLILLIVLIGVIAAAAFFLVQGEDSGAGAGPATEAVSGMVEGEVGEEAAAAGEDAVAEATNLISSKLILFVAGGIAAAILMLVYVIPAGADLVSSFFYSSEEEYTPDASSLAVAKIAQGDYEGAIEEYRTLIEENPTDRFPVIEISKLYLDKLTDPDGAVAFLEESLNDKEWPVDDAAFLMFRVVEIELEHRANPIRARELLTMIVDNFEGTRHASNAEHKIEAIDAGSWAKST